MSTRNKHQRRVQWRLRTPGAAQQHLENLFSTGEIRKDMTPSVCYNKYDVFKAFSMDVFKKIFMQQKTDLDVLMMIPKNIMNKVRIIINNFIIINNKYHKLT